MSIKVRTTACVLALMVSTSGYCESGDECMERLQSAFDTTEEYFLAQPGGVVSNLECRHYAGGAMISTIEFGCDEEPLSFGVRIDLEGEKGDRTCSIEGTTYLDSETATHYTCGLDPNFLPLPFPISALGTEPLDSEADYRAVRAELSKLCRGAVRP